EVRAAIAGNQIGRAQGIAAQRAVAALSDLAVAQLAAGRLEDAITQMEQVLRFQPASQHAFHNFAAILLAHGLLRGTALENLQNHLARCWNSQRWARDYQNVLCAPRFLNLEFVSGKCNLRCRMCVGGHGKSAPGQLEYMSCEEFDRMLAAVPTVSGLTLSSGDSEPLLHPQFEQIIEVAERHHVFLNVYTNGHPLNARKARKIVQSGVVSMVNFSLDAATPETYRRIRGEDFNRVIQKIEMLCSMIKEAGAEQPLVSFSFVAMADNIAELPAFVGLAHRLGAGRVYVEQLIGWNEADSVNRPATDHPQCSELVREATECAAQLGVRLELPGRLRVGREPETASPAPTSAALESAARSTRLMHHCGWLNGVWVQRDGRFDPCCLIHGVADLGNVKDGPILKNRKYAGVKGLLLDGSVFAECADQRACQFVQQQKAAGIPLRVIPKEQLDGLGCRTHERTPPGAASQADEAAEVLLAVAEGVARE
ncbi:MAG TPA: radical SAM protein, partial [Phycisphaerae bacterium]|nr:radical SAM protein [Phycisphaerae bacterium]